MKSIEIENAVANLFNIRTNTIVPNVCWGLNLHECDLLVVRHKTRYAVEVEIKVSKQDLKNDAKKQHRHASKKIKQLYFAVPVDLYEAAKEYCPPQAGIIVCGYLKGSYDTPVLTARIKRQAKQNKDARPFTEKEMNELQRLGCMRIWGLKKKVMGYVEDAKLSTYKDFMPESPVRAETASLF